MNTLHISNLIDLVEMTTESQIKSICKSFVDIEDCYVSIDSICIMDDNNLGFKILIETPKFELMFVRIPINRFFQ